MPRANENCNGTKYSNTRARLSQRNGKIQKLQHELSTLQQQLSSITNDFEEEKNAKNQAYYYIISSGNFKRFAEFCKKHPANLDYHGACVAELFLRAITNEI